MPSSPTSQPARRSRGARQCGAWSARYPAAAAARLPGKTGPAAVAGRHAQPEEGWRVRLEGVTALSRACHDEALGAWQTGTGTR
jgi:hypothetical protein